MNIQIPHSPAQSLRLNWTQCYGDVWCKLNFVNLDHEHFDNEPRGVYIIWHGGPNPKVVYIGQGNIKERIAEHRNNPEIQQYESEYLDLYVTWAVVQGHDRDGVEAYLADVWKPIVGTRHPQASPIEVNSPW